jgi:HAD superfamily hydrolase (TIGR01458 family)
VSEGAARQGFLLDVDGVLHVGVTPVPGAAAFLDGLAARGIPYRLLTNTTTASRASLAERLRGIGLPVADGDLLTAPVATAAFIRRRFPGARCYLLAKGDVVDDFRAVGLTMVGPDGAPAADVVVIGGAEDELTYARLNHAYRLLLGGARLIAMHRNTAWRTADGMSLDSGPFILALERAAGVRATVVGKPALPFFRHGLRELGLPPAAVTMVGDDAHNDLRPATRLGMRTVLVRTGKPVGPADAALADVVVDSVAAL